MSIDKIITLDLNGKSIKAGERMTTNIKVYSSGSLTLEDSSSDGNGRIYTEDAYVNVDNGYGIIRVFGVFIMNSGKVEAVIESDPQNKGQFGIGVGTNGKVTINGGEIKAGWFAVSNNANDSGSEITVNGGTLISTADYAIYNPGKSSSLTINGGTIYGEAGGIAMFQGSLHVIDGKITSKGKGDTGEWGDGTGFLSNAALYVGTSKSGYGNVSAIIEGGLFTAEGNAVVLNSANGKYSIKLELKGGSFSSDPSEYVAEGYVAENKDYSYVVRALKDNDVAVVDGVVYSSLAKAIENAASNSIIRLLRDASGDGIESRDSGKASYRDGLTIDFSGHTYTMTDSSVGSEGEENKTQAMHWGDSLGFVVLKNGKFKVGSALTSDGRHIIAMQNYVNFTAEDMEFDFESIEVGYYPKFDKNHFNYPDYAEKEIPLFNNNKGMMLLVGCTVKMPFDSTKGISADGDGVTLKDTVVDGYVNLKDSNSKLMTIGSSSVKGVVSYFGNGAVKEESSDGVTTYTLTLE